MRAVSRALLPVPALSLSVRPRPSPRARTSTATSTEARRAHEEQGRRAEHERRRRRAVSRALLSALVLRVRDEPPGSSPLRLDGAARDGEENGAAGEVEEGRNGQQSTSDSADAPSLMPLLSASGVMKARAGTGRRTGDEESAKGVEEVEHDTLVSCLSTLLATSLRAHRCCVPRAWGRMRWSEDHGGRVEQGRSGQQGTRVDADAPSLVLLLSASVLRVCDEPPSSSLLRSKGAGTTGSRRQRQSMHSMYCNG